MPKRKTELASVSDLFATLERSSSLRFETSSNYQSSSSGYLTRAKVKSKPMTVRQPRLESVLSSAPDFASYEQYNLLIESDHSKDNAPAAQSGLDIVRRLDALSMDDKRRSEDSSLSYSTSTANQRPNLFCSTPGPRYSHNEKLSVTDVSKPKESRRVASLENIVATPILCPEPIVEGSRISDSVLRHRNNSWVQLGVRTNADMVPSKKDDGLQDASCDKSCASAISSGPSRGPWNAEGGKKSGAYVKRLTRRFRIDNMILNHSYWTLYEAGDPMGTLLKICGQTKFRKFSDVFTPYRRRHLRKIGEGCFGEVFSCPTRLTASTAENNSMEHDSSTEVIDELVAVKLVPVEGSVLFNGDNQKTFSEVLSEVIVAKELTALSFGFRNHTKGFVQLKKVHLVCGAVPAYLVKAWENYNRGTRSENDHPRIFPKNQVWLAIEMLFSGTALEYNVPPCPAARLSVLRQVALSLAVAESELHFEHRDLHWGNVLVRTRCSDLARTSSTEDCCQFCVEQQSAGMTSIFRLNYQVFNVPTYGLHAAIIDFTLSRLEQDGGSVYVDLASDHTLFESQGDYQFDVYRLMRTHNGNQWNKFTPKTNVMWLHYLATKLLLFMTDPVPSSEDSLHSSSMKYLTQLEADLRTLSHHSASDVVLKHPAFSVVRS